MCDDTWKNDVCAGAPVTVELLHRCNNFTGSTITEEQIQDIDIAAVIQLLPGDIFIFCLHANADDSIMSCVFCELSCACMYL